MSFRRLSDILTGRGHAVAVNVAAATFHRERPKRDRLRFRCRAHRGDADRFSKNCLEDAEVGLFEMNLGYNTNGFAHHRLEDALEILAEIGFRRVAITLERDSLDPPDRKGASRAVDVIRPLLESFQLTATIETGSRFLLDPRRKHQPTLISGSAAERQVRIEFLNAAIDVAAGLSAESVSLWSGAPNDEAGEEELFDRLMAGLSEVLAHAESLGVRIAFEPEPGMLIATMAQFERLHDRLRHTSLGLTLDVGHVCCLDDGAVSAHVRRWRDVLWNVHMEDMRRGCHEHLMFGEGDVNFGEVFAALRDIDYAGPIHVELSRHSHDAVATAGKAYTFLQPYLT